MITHDHEKPRHFHSEVPRCRTVRSGGGGFGAWERFRDQGHAGSESRIDANGGVGTKSASTPKCDRRESKIAGRDRERNRSICSGRAVVAVAASGSDGAFVVVRAAGHSVWWDGHQWPRRSSGGVELQRDRSVGADVRGGRGIWRHRSERIDGRVRVFRRNDHERLVRLAGGGVDGIQRWQCRRRFLCGERVARARPRAARGESDRVFRGQEKRHRMQSGPHRSMVEWRVDRGGILHHRH